MKFITDYRASTILFNFILSNDKKKGIWILPTNVCHFVATTILKTGSKIEILDISEKDLCLNPIDVLDRLQNTEKVYSGIIYVRSFGSEQNVNPFFKKIKEVNEDILLVDDKCLSIPSLSDDLNALVDLELYSTGYSKYVDLAYGGYAKLNNNCSYFESKLKYNKVDEEIFASFFRSIIFEANPVDEDKLKQIIESNWLETRKMDRKTYFKEIRSKLIEVEKTKKELNKIYEDRTPQKMKLSSSSCNWRYNILVENSTLVLEELKKNDLFASKHYFPLSKIFSSEETPVWNVLFKRILNLFNDFRYSKLQAEKTMLIIKKLEN